jgi:DNA ligase-1
MTTYALTEYRGTATERISMAAPNFSVQPPQMLEEGDRRFNITNNGGNMPQFQPLYKPDTKGNACIWSISVNDDSYTISHGKVGGKIQDKTTICAPKNIGRSNESTGREQALKEAEAKWIERKDRKGYGLTVEEATDCNKPMLAMDYHKAGHRITYPCGVQPKLDGVRAFVERVSANVVSITSRTGKEFPADLSHIEQWAISYLEPGMVLDGELYIHGKELEDIVSAVKKTKPSTADVQFWVFDFMRGADFVENTTSARLSFLWNHLETPVGGPIHLVETCEAHTEEHMKEIHKKYVDQGYEGIMLRNFTGAYKAGKRSPDLQKYKTFLDEEFMILSVLEDKDGNPVFQLACGDDARFQCVLKGDKDVNRAKYITGDTNVIGKYMTVKYQKKYRDSGLPQFPTGVAIRDYE